MNKEFWDGVDFWKMTDDAYCVYAGANKQNSGLLQTLKYHSEPMAFYYYEGKLLGYHFRVGRKLAVKLGFVKK